MDFRPRLRWTGWSPGRVRFAALWGAVATILCAAESLGWWFAAESMVLSRMGGGLWGAVAVVVFALRMVVPVVALALCVRARRRLAFLDHGVPVLRGYRIPVVAMWATWVTWFLLSELVKRGAYSSAAFDRFAFLWASSAWGMVVFLPLVLAQVLPAVVAWLSLWWWGNQEHSRARVESN